MTNTSLLQTPFQKLLGPVSREEFFDRYWQKQSLLVQDRGDRGWPFTFDRDAFFGSLEQCSHLKMVFENEDGAHRECQIQAPQAARMYEAGNTLCATRVDNGNADLHRFLRKLERELWGGEFHTNAYLSPGNKGFGTHFDYHSVWVLQIEGRKRWWFGDTPALTDPLTTIVYPMDRETLRLPWYAIDRPDESAFHEVVLEPGDMLYLPTGVWHKTRADEYSLSITLGHEPVQAGKLVSDHIAHAMWSDDACRRHLPVVLNGVDAEAASDDAVRATIADALDALRSRLDRLTVDQLHHAWNAQSKKGLQKRVQEGTAGTTGAEVPASLALRSPQRNAPAL